jgi:hypothetical protein
MPTQYSSKQYEWNDISVNVLGRTIKGLRAIKYTIKQDKKVIYGRGNKPLAIQSGNKSFEGEVEMLQSEVDGLVAVAKSKNPNAHLTDINFDIVWSFANGNDIQTRVIEGVEVTEYDNSIKQGDIEMPVVLKFIALDVLEVA